MEGFNISERALTLDDLRHEDENGVEFWYARDLQKLMGYTEWRNFEIAIARAMTSAQTGETPVGSHFVEVNKMVALGGGAQRGVKDYRLTRYACYLIAMNGDPRKQEIAFAQSYFALQTRNHELIGRRMMEIQRLESRGALSETEKMCAAVAFERDVDGQGIARIKSFGDRALFGGNDTRAMKRRLGVKGSKALADVLPDVTLAAKNLAMAMTTHNVEEKDLRGEDDITVEHVDNNSSVRSTLTGRGIYPEDLPAEEDTKKLERRVRADERKLLKVSRGFEEDGEGA